MGINFNDWGNLDGHYAICDSLGETPGKSDLKWKRVSSAIRRRGL